MRLFLLFWGLAPPPYWTSFCFPRHWIRFALCNCLRLPCSFFHSSGVSGSSILCVFDSTHDPNASFVSLSARLPGGIMGTLAIQPKSTSLVMAASRASRLIATSVIVTTVERARKVYCNASRRSFFNSRSASVALA